MGLGYDDVAARHPPAVYVSISGFGNTVETPYRDWPAYASIVEAMSGIYDYRHPRRAAGDDSRWARSATSAPRSSA